MARVKSKFGYAEPIDTAPELDEEFENEITGIVDTSSDLLPVFLDEIRLHIHRYGLRKKARTSVVGGRPTAGQTAVNARELKKTVDSLIEQLAGESGGLKYHLHHGISLVTSGNPEHVGTRKLIKILEGVRYGCDDFLDDLDGCTPRYEPSSTHDESLELLSPLDRFAYDIAKSIRDTLGEEPTDKIYEGDNRRGQVDGKLAQILIACSTKAEKGLVRDWRSLMRRAIKKL